MRDVNIYIESSIKGAKRKNGIVGIVLQAGNDDAATKSIFGIVKDVTAYEAILICLSRALGYIKQGCGKIYIHTDSGYVYQNCSTTRQIQWLESGFKTSKGEEVKYKAQWQAIYRGLSGKEFEVVYNQPNSFKGWLKNEVERRALEHGF